MKTAHAAQVTVSRRHTSLWAAIWKNRIVYTLLIPGLVWYVIFAYGPMGGLVLAFKRYRANLGIWGSPWIGMQNFQYVFVDAAFYKSVIKTLTINIGRMVFQFPMPIILALLLNEMRFTKLKRSIQTVLTFPHFLSWVVVASIIINLLAYNGLVNNIIKLFTGGTIFNFLGNTQVFIPMLYVTEVWKNAGWSAIVYLAAISGINTDQYEAAEIDGASRFQKLFSITLPNITPTIIVMFILAMGGLMSTGFDQVFNLSNPAVRDVAETLDMYIYRITFLSPPNFAFSTAVSLFRSIVNMVLLLLADRGAKMMGSDGLLG
ncbi:MAG: ABC transporter permease subunit [Oscillospiraceae bacterium]|jgi:putative aldouronate transport system permease protein|nr:ABC transporter permease subunit [Oscillospiraceae bacterium]